ncbi:MAG: YihY/virulence factor BrkB family protein, partial [Haloarculaceae archaeon]
MSDDEGTGTGSSSDGSGPSAEDLPGGAPRGRGDSADVEPMDVETVDPEEVERLRRRIEEFEADIEDRTVHREDLESDLERYVRRKLRRGHARGWGPYVVLLYGTVMTLGAFYFLSGIWAILAMVVIWLSTLGLYVVMLMVGWVGAAI